MNKILAKIGLVMNFSKNNWFNLGILIIFSIGVGSWIKFQYETLKIERYKAEQSAFNWASDSSLGRRLIGSKELGKFASHFWDLFDY